MRPSIYIFLLIATLGCTAKKHDIFIIPFERGQADLKVGLDTITNKIIFSNEFWKHLTSTFPTATMSIFIRGDDAFDNIIHLTDSTYSYGLLSNSNRIFLVNHLPKNLSKKESDSYWEGPAFFVIVDSTNTKNKHKPEIALGKHWSKASVSVEKEYLRFYNLLTVYHPEYAVIVKRSLIDSVLEKYR